MLELPVYVLVAAAAVAASIPVLWWSLASQRVSAKAVARNLGGGQVTDMRQAVLERSAKERAVRPVVGALANRARRLTPAGTIEGLEHRITLAGLAGSWPVERVLAAKLLLGFGGLGFGLLQLLAQRSAGWLLVAVAAPVVAFLVPDILLSQRARKRQGEIRRALADTLDEITISVEAGLGFEAALAHAGRTGSGPLADEIIRTLQEIQVGVARAQALRNLIDRTDVDDLRHFVLAVLQAEHYGVPIAQVLRVQSKELRVKRRQWSEERAMKMPVKVVFPLVLCILPTLFIVLVGPAAIRIASTFLGGG